MQRRSRSRASSGRSCREPSRAPLLAALVLAAAAAFAPSSPALAGDVLELRSGELVPGRVVALDDQGVTFAREAGGEIRVGWDKVWPGCRFDLWERSLAADDATGRVRLGEFGIENELWGPARRVLVQAKGLGHADPASVDAKLAELRRLEADDAIAEAEALSSRAELEKALDRIRTYLRGAEPGADADRARALVPDLLARIEKRDLDAKEDEEARRQAEKDGKLKEWISKQMKSADARKAEGGKQAADGFTQLAAGNQTRTRDHLAKSEAAYKAARDLYAKVRKAVRTGDVAEECAERMKDCDLRVVEVLARWGRMECDNKAWKKASPVVDRGLVTDPVNKELLDLRKLIDESWVRRKLSGITNATGHSSSN
ncbi:MAG: hypothetical protein HMLKMBBP_00921 [Planctomycetes bacterium]|nr:hypothetical protein [Planctomycetota bacterium]